VAEILSDIAVSSCERWFYYIEARHAFQVKMLFFLCDFLGRGLGETALWPPKSGFPQKKINQKEALV
jgi:hypothetical protein